jgi:hypothetical protein
MKYIDDIFSDKYSEFEIPNSEIKKYLETYYSLSDDTKKFLNTYYLDKSKSPMLNEDQLTLLYRYGLTFQKKIKPTIKYVSPVSGSVPGSVPVLVLLLKIMLENI